MIWLQPNVTEQRATSLSYFRVLQLTRFLNVPARRIWAVIKGPTWSIVAKLDDKPTFSLWCCEMLTEIFNATVYGGAIKVLQFFGAHGGTRTQVELVREGNSWKHQQLFLRFFFNIAENKIEALIPVYSLSLPDASIKMDRKESKLPIVPSRKPILETDHETCQKSNRTTPNCGSLDLDIGAHCHQRYAVLVRS